MGDCRRDVWWRVSGPDAYGGPKRHRRVRPRRFARGFCSVRGRRTAWPLCHAAAPVARSSNGDDYTETLSPYLALLRTNRNFRLLYIGQTISQLGDWFNTVAVYALLLDLTGSATAVAWMMIVQFLPVAVFGPMAGLIVDRVNRRGLMLATDLVRRCLILLLL